MRASGHPVPDFEPREETCELGVGSGAEQAVDGFGSFEIGRCTDQSLQVGVPLPGIRRVAMFGLEDGYLAESIVEDQAINAFVAAAVTDRLIDVFRFHPPDGSEEPS